MNSEQLKYLARIKKLVKKRKRRFKIRKDRDYLADLLELGITEEEAWNHVLLLNNYYYIPDYKPDYTKEGESLLFKKIINGIMAYIKLKIEVLDSGEEVVCWSFHPDNKNKE